jgi:threonine dehydrogenase-like Zn-dependent dehydrogenase
MYYPHGKANIFEVLISIAVSKRVEQGYWNEQPMRASSARVHAACAQFMGIVEDLGPDVKNFKKGDRVVASFDMGCGKCFYCQRGLYTCCSTTNPSNILCPLYGHKLSAMHGVPHPISHH